jgi:DNA-binding transcriptional regulator YdaS (Cro superfamily)
MSTSATRYEALCACVAAAGDQSKLGRALGVAQATIWRWLNQSKQMPAEYVLRAEALYGVSRHDLRPDIYPREPHGDVTNMIDHPGEDRFVGIDVRRAGRARPLQGQAA